MTANFGINIPNDRLLPPGTDPDAVESATRIVRAGSTSAQILAKFADLAPGTRITFEEQDDPYELESSPTIDAVGVQVDCTRADIQQNGTRVPGFIVEADDVKIRGRRLIYHDPTTRWTYTADQAATIRGERATAWCCGVWSNGNRGDFQFDKVEGFYVGFQPTSWNLDTNDYDPEGTYRYGNKFTAEVSDVDFGCVPWGQYGLDTHITGSYEAAPWSIHPPHGLYYTSTRGSRSGRGTGHMWESTGTGKVAVLVRSGTVSGGTFTVTVGGATATGLAYNISASALTAAIEALAGVGAGNAMAYTSSAGWYIVLARGLGQVTITSNAAGITGGGTITTSELQPFDSGGAWRFKELVGGTFTLSSDDCPGYAEVYENSANIRINGQALRDKAPGGGSIIMDSSVSNVKIEADVDLGVDTRAIRIDGTDCEVISRITAETDGSLSSSAYVTVQGTRPKVDVEIINSGTGGWRGVQVLAGSSAKVKLRKMKDVAYPFQISAGVLGCSLEYCPGDIDIAAGGGGLLIAEPTTAVTRLPHRKIVNVTGSGTYDLDPTFATEYVLNITTTSNFTIRVPSGTHSVNGMTMDVEFQNNSGGTLGTITQTSMNVGAFIKPANGAVARGSMYYNGSTWAPTPETRSFRGWLADDAQTVYLCEVPVNHYVKVRRVEVTEAFNSDGNDFVTVGRTAFPDAIMDDVDVSTTGEKTPVAGSQSPVITSATSATLYYANGGTEPTTGKALVVVELTPIAAAPA